MIAHPGPFRFLQVSLSCTGLALPPTASSVFFTLALDTAFDLGQNRRPDRSVPSLWGSFRHRPPHRLARPSPFASLVLRRMEPLRALRHKDMLALLLVSRTRRKRRSVRRPPVVPRQSAEQESWALSPAPNI